MEVKYIKLVNGEEIIAEIENNNAIFFTVHNPIALQVVKFTQGDSVIETFVMQPWLKIAKTQTTQLPISNIIAMSDVIDVAVKQYHKFVEKKLNNYDVTDVLDEDGDFIDDYDDLEQYFQTVDNEADSDYDNRQPTRKTIH